MLTADLDRELARSLLVVTTEGGLPAAAATARTCGTWRPAPDGAPACYATALPFELAALAGREPAVIAAALARPLTAAAWIEAVGVASGYLTITVSQQALARSAAEMAAAGPACATSTILAGTTTTAVPWPDPAAARSWQQAWQDQAFAMTAQLARAAGASVTAFSGGERGSLLSVRDPGGPRPAAAATAYFGLDLVRYALARTPPGGDLPPAGLLVPERWADIAASRCGRADPLAVVQQAHAAAASALRWAAELGIDRTVSADRLGALLPQPAERALLTLLSFLAVRVATAARRQRPAELLAYLDDVSSAWQSCQRAGPALPFGGRAAPRDAEAAAARLVLADAVRAVLATGLALTGIAASGRL